MITKGEVEDLGEEEACEDWNEDKDAAAARFQTRRAWCLG